MKQCERKLTVEATLDNLSRVLGFLEDTAKQAGCPGKVMKQIAVSVEEMYVNIVNYAYAPDVGECRIELAAKQSGAKGKLIIRMRDAGRPFNPLEKEDPDVTLPIDKREIGGLGIYMAKQSMDCMEYRYTDGENHLIMEKSWTVK